MKIHNKQDYSAQMAAFTEKIRKKPNQEGTDNLSNDKLELLKQFVNYLESENHEKYKCKHQNGNREKFERANRFIFGHGFGKHGHHGKHRHGEHHHRFEKHHHGHGRHGKHHHGGKPFWTMSRGETQAVIEIDANASDASRGTKIVTGTNIGRQVPHFKTHRSFCKRWLECKRNHCQADQSCQTEERTNPQETLTSEVQNISIENSPTVDLMKE